MNNNELKAKLLAGSKRDESWMKEAEERIINEKWQDLSFAIAVRILSSLKAKKMTQVQLAEKVGVSAQMINKIVKGKENLTLETNQFCFGYTLARNSCCTCKNPTKAC